MMRRQTKENDWSKESKVLTKQDIQFQTYINQAREKFGLYCLLITVRRADSSLKAATLCT